MTDSIDIAPYRAASSAYCHRATGGDAGRIFFGDPVYREVTEGRDPGPGYSSCGDLGHASLFHVGVRLTWINRKEHNGWKSGLNVARLARKPEGSGADGCARAPKVGDKFETGDVLIVWRDRKGNDDKTYTQDAHVIVVDSFDGKTLKSWEYGQGPMSAAKWPKGSLIVEGAHREKVLRVVGDRYMLDDGRFVQSHLSLAAAVNFAAAHNALVPILPPAPVGVC